MDLQQKLALVDTIPDPSVLKDSTTIEDNHSRVIHTADLVLALRGDETWRYGIFIHNVSKTSLMKIEVGKKGEYKEIPGTHVRVLKQ